MRDGDGPAVGQVLVVVEGEAAAGGAADVELDAVGAEGGRGGEGGRGVLGRGPGGAAMPDDQCAAWGDRNHVHELVLSMEKKILAVRRNDRYLCSVAATRSVADRGGM